MKKLSISNSPRPDLPTAQRHAQRTHRGALEDEVALCASEPLGDRSESFRLGRVGDGDEEGEEEREETEHCVWRRREVERPTKEKEESLAEADREEVTRAMRLAKVFSLSFSQHHQQAFFFSLYTLSLSLFPTQNRDRARPNKHSKMGENIARIALLSWVASVFVVFCCCCLDRGGCG